MTISKKDTGVDALERADKPLSEAARDEIKALAQRQLSANGLLLKAINYVGGQIEDTLDLLPDAVTKQINAATRTALRYSYDAAASTRGGSIGAALQTDKINKTLATISGAIGGVGGVTTALLELPVATTLIFRAVQGVAGEYEEDPKSDETRMQCLAVFGAGAPGDEDDGVDTAFLSARLGITGAAVNGLIKKVAPRFATILSQKFATQAVPVLGAVAGAGTNYAFVDYYVEIAHVHFGLRKLAREHGKTAVEDEFHVALAACTVPVKRA